MRKNMGLYKGKVMGGDIWAEGFYAVFGTGHFIGAYDNESGTVVWVEVIPETVGQFTGIYDSTEWEGLTPEEQQAFLHLPDGWENIPEAWGGKQIFEGDILEWDAREWGCEHREVAEWDYSLLDARKHDWHEWCKVIGNVHDNPELLEANT